MSRMHTPVNAPPTVVVIPYARPAAHAAEADSAGKWGFPEWFVVVQILSPALLYLPGTQPLRIPIRVFGFGVSLLALVLWGSRSRRAVGWHRAVPWLIIAASYLALMIFHPTTNSFTAGAAQVLLYLSVLAPIFWAPGMVRSPQQLQRLLAILLVCNGINSLVGIMQVYDPDRWLPKEYSSVQEGMPAGLLTFRGDNGERIVRPTGLSDNPGAVCGPGAVAAVLGMIFFSRPGPAWKRLGSLACAFAGVAVVYLSHVRTSILILAGSLLIYGVILWWQNQGAKGVAFVGMVAGLLFTAYLFATAMGGSSVAERFMTLFEEDPTTVYYRAGRGGQMEYAARVLAYEYPLGAGLARWGMMRYYFGDAANAESSPLWAEVQLSAWLLDGGLVLTFAYLGALLGTTYYEFRLAASARDRKVRSVAAIVFAVNGGTLALMFGFTPFTTQVGLQYWFLAGSLYGLAQLRTGSAA